MFHEVIGKRPFSTLGYGGIIFEEISGVAPSFIGLVFRKYLLEYFSTLLSFSDSVFVASSFNSDIGIDPVTGCSTVGSLIVLSDEVLIAFGASGRTDSS